jgi:hypothetical protein
LRNGILFVPSSYVINEGMAISLKKSFEYIQNIQKFELKRAIFDRNNMNDYIFSNVLNGILLRPEFYSLTSIRNEIGDDSSK